MSLPTSVMPTAMFDHVKKTVVQSMHEEFTTLPFVHGHNSTEIWRKAEPYEITLHLKKQRQTQHDTAASIINSNTLLN